MAALGSTPAPCHGPIPSGPIYSAPWHGDGGAQDQPGQPAKSCPSPLTHGGKSTAGFSSPPADSGPSGPSAASANPPHPPASAATPGLLPASLWCTSANATAPSPQHQ
ncbi:hypothetical protein F751_2880 [Auxenochlorella protothecoides]|uniref:Uncharacterized protein n=1 Tax=Auxenochlorella protothecoides TaxID=3075 RepID=A0A087SD17_AUXPR|nr:hypothetical protein F751_2880 [Auxenochlorella protothecoides]KFM23621.1 hypothetical protein F751_2880 [Auxenochlorella protothecoides]